MPVPPDPNRSGGTILPAGRGPRSSCRWAGLLVLLPAAIGGGCASPDGPPANDPLSRWYSEPPDLVSRIASEALQGLQFRVVEDLHDSEGGDIVAIRPGQSASLRFLRIEWDETRLSLRLDQPDAQLGQQILDEISTRIGAQSYHPRASRAILKGWYKVPVGRCASVAELVLEFLKMRVCCRTIAFDRAELAAKTDEDHLVEVKIRAIDAQTSRLRFAAAAPTQVEADSLALRLRTQFEAALRRSG